MTGPAVQLPVVTNLEFETGVDFSTNLNLVDQNGNPLNLTGMLSSVCSIKRAPGGATLASFTVTVTQPIAGQVTLGLAAAANILEGGSSATDPLGAYVWDLLIELQAGTYIRPAGGALQIIQGVS